MPEPPIHIAGSAGGDVVPGSKTVIQQAGGDIVGRDKITYQAPAVGIAALHQLPSPPAGFTGRAAELAELRPALREQGAAISGVRGLGGVGKTALALVLAHELAADYPDAQIFVNLQGVTQPLAPEAVMAHVIRAYQPIAKLPDDPAQLAAIYRSVLAGQRALLLFDNARDAAQIKPLLPPAGCLLLLTSRQKFTLPGLTAINLDSLPPADAEALLLKLASRIGDHAARLARLCGYLPLALTLAGGALAEREDLEPEQYLNRLEHSRLALLDEVAASLALSDDLLSPELQRLWRRLSVFPADFMVDGAGALWSMELDLAGDRLSDLLRFSLLEFNQEVKRYRLHDLARDFARSRLSEAERDDAQRRHAEHYKNVLAVADSLYMKGESHIQLGLALFDVERANIFAGQAWAAAHAEQDETAARLTSEYPDAGVYVLALRQHPREKIAWLEAGLAAARRLKNRPAEGGHLGNLGNAYAALGEPRRAIDYYKQRISIARELGDRRGKSSTQANLGLAYANLGQPRRAIEYYERALKIQRSLGDRRAEAVTLGNLGRAYADLGEHHKAIAYYEQALLIVRPMGDRLREEQILENLGGAYFELGEPRRAIEYYEQGLAISRAIGDRLGEGDALAGLSAAYNRLDDPRQAVACAQQGLAISREIGARSGESNASWNLGILYTAQGDWQRAKDLLQFTVDYEREIGHPNAEADAAKMEELRKRLEGG